MTDEQQPAPNPIDLTQILHQAKDGSDDARADVIQAAYAELRKLAAGKMAAERQDHTLSSTALVNEVSMRMLSDANVPLDSRKQFFAYASKAMRNLLVDHARTKGRQKRGGDLQRYSFDEALDGAMYRADEFLMLHESLEQLSESDPRKAQVVEMRYFGGMSNQEVAESLDISLATVKRDWDVARVWLLNQLKDGDTNAEV